MGAAAETPVRVLTRSTILLLIATKQLLKMCSFTHSPACIGQEVICKQLHTCCLLSSKPDLQRQQKRYVIYRLGGSGETQVCLQFVEDHREEYGSPVCFCSVLMMTVLQVLGYILAEHMQLRKLEAGVPAGG